MATLDASSVLTTLTLASCQLVSYKKEYYAMQIKGTDLLIIVLRNRKKTFDLLVLCIMIKFTVACSLISFDKGNL